MNESFRQIEYFYNKIPNENNIMICEYLFAGRYFANTQNRTNTKKHPISTLKNVFKMYF